MSGRYALLTFGCQMNVHDEERVRGVLNADGWMECTLEEADAVVILTCCVRRSAEDRLYGRLSALKTLKDERGLTVAVGGCLAQKEGIALFDRAPHVDVVFGTHQYPNIASLLAVAGGGRVCSTAMQGLEMARVPCRRREDFRAWVTITHGCDNFCSYCIVPYVRGGEQSRRLEDIENEVGAHVSSGAVEINLLGQNVNSYRRKEEGRSRFADLLRRLGRRHPGAWIRFTTSHPRDLDTDIVRAIAETPNICEHVHLPLQSGSDRILAAMRRDYTSSDYLRKVEELRQRVPGVSVSTDLIVGYPGENEDDFHATMEMAERCRFDAVFTFLYNPRDGTSAAKERDDVAPSVKQERLERLLDVTRTMTCDSMSFEVASVQTVLVHGPSRRDASCWSARTRNNKIVHLQRGEDDLAGRFVEVRITGAGKRSLRGVLESPAG